MPKIDLDAVLAATSLKALAEDAGAVWDLKKSRPKRQDWWAPCPLHGEATASFHVTEKPGRDEFKCFGCGAGGSAVDFVMARDGVDYLTALRALAAGADLDPAEAEKRKAQAAKLRAEAEAQAAEEAQRNRHAALQIWGRAKPSRAVLRDYLLARGLDGLGPRIPGRLRFHDDLAAPCGHRGPAMVALIGRECFKGVHRTWITPQGRARTPEGGKVAKAWLGETGAMFGQPVTLAPPDPSGLLVVGEGIETSLAGLKWARANGHPNAWAEAALSLGALTGSSAHPGWLPPRDQRAPVLVLADPSSRHPDKAKADAVGAVDKLHAHGFSALYRAPLGRFDHDKDFADLALEGLL